MLLNENRFVLRSANELPDATKHLGKMTIITDNGLFHVVISNGEEWMKVSFESVIGGSPNIIGSPVLGLERFFEDGTQGVWIDPSDFSTLYQDSDGMIPVTDVGQPIGLILDKSGRGNHLIQPTPNQRPTLGLDENGYHIAFDGSNDLVSTQQINLGSAASFFLHAHVEGTPTVNQVLLQTGTDIERPSVRIHHDVDSRFSATLLTSLGNNRYQSSVFAPPVKALISAVCDLNESGIDEWAIYRVNKADARVNILGGFADAEGEFNSQLHVGARASATQALAGRIYGIVIISGRLDMNDIQSVENYLSIIRFTNIVGSPADIGSPA